MQREAEVQSRTYYVLAIAIFNLNQCVKECFVINAILQMLEKLSAKNQAEHPLTDYAADWDESMRELRNFFVEERMDKARSHSGLMWKNGNYLWIRNHDQPALVEYRQWLEKDIADEILKYSHEFADQVKKPGMTLQKLNAYYELLLKKNFIERLQHDENINKIIEELDKSYLNERQKRYALSTRNIVNATRPSDEAEQNVHDHSGATPALRRG